MEVAESVTSQIASAIGDHIRKDRSRAAWKFLVIQAEMRIGSTVLCKEVIIQQKSDV